MSVIGIIEETDDGTITSHSGVAVHSRLTQSIAIAGAWTVVRMPVVDINNDLHGGVWDTVNSRFDVGKTGYYLFDWT